MSLPSLTTRLFPKNQGADAYAVTGLAARCDWVLLSDWHAPQIKLVKHRSDRPRHIFVSLRAPFVALLHFAQQILPQLTEPFVLISGSEDITLPQQTDQRWRQYNSEENAAIRTILNHPLMLRWFVENLDDATVDKMQPLPLGLIDVKQAADWPDVPRLSERPLRVLCAHRLRDGPQWEVRRHVSALARGPWKAWTTVLEDDIPEADFLDLLQQHAFVICAQGGGIDPSPKAWQSLMYGAVPLYSAPSLRRAYNQLPTIHVPNWTAESITLPRLQQWHAWACPRMDERSARRSLRERLSLDYWWRQIEEPIRQARPFCLPASGRIC